MIRYFFCVAVTGAEVSRTSFLFAVEIQEFSSSTDSGCLIVKMNYFKRVLFTIMVFSTSVASFTKSSVCCYELPHSWE